MPTNITPVPLPTCSSELNPVERVWLDLKEPFLSMRLLNDDDTIIAAASKAWNRLKREGGCLASLTSSPRLMKLWWVEHQARRSTTE